MKTWKADTVLHDGAPNVGLGWVQDAFSQSQLTLQALKLAVENLVVNGTFVTKIFRSKDYNKLMWVFQQLFDKVEATKPPASRNVSAEIFVVCRGFKAPKRLDPRLLDAREVFEELPDKPQNMEARVFNPEKRVRKRQGYEEGDNLLYHEADILEFVKNEDPISVLGYMNKFTIDENQHEWKIVKKISQTNDEFLACIQDLKVLGKKEFKMLLKWRKAARELLGLDQKEEEEKIEVEPLDEEAQIDKELQDLQEKQRMEQKRERRRRNEAKMKEINRMNMNMLTPTDLGIEAAELGRDSMFNLKTAEKTGILDKLAKGKRRMIFAEDDSNKDDEIYLGEGTVLHDRTDPDEANDLEAELDEMYSQYKLRKAERDAKFKAKQARGGDVDDNWEGFTNESEEKDNLDNDDRYEEESTGDSDSDDDESINNLISKLKGKSGDQKLSNKAKMLFNDPIFDNVEADIPQKNGNKTKLTEKQDEPEDEEDVDMEVEATVSGDSKDKETEESESDSSDFELVAHESSGDEGMDSDYDSDEERKETGRKRHAQDVEIATVEAMTLAHQLALGQKTKHDLVDEGFNRYAFRDTEHLPEWFVEDERQHSKVNRPITKEAALALKEKLKALNARPIKKVAEAKARKKMRSVARLEKIKKKAGLIADEGDKSEKDKAEEISRLMRKVSKKDKRKPRPTLVVAKGSNRGLAGRPKGVRGKYKMVDGVMKNEQRALKRIAKKHHKKK